MIDVGLQELDHEALIGARAQRYRKLPVGLVCLMPHAFRKLVTD